MADSQLATTTSVFGYHVIPIGRLWKVTIPGDSATLSMHTSKDAAVTDALVRAARGTAHAVIVHRPDGSIEASLSPDEPQRKS